MMKNVEILKIDEKKNLNALANIQQVHGVLQENPYDMDVKKM